MSKIVKRGPKSICLNKTEWAWNFRSVAGNLALCTEGVHKAFNLPDNVSEIWLVPFKRGGETRAKITIDREGDYIRIDGHDYGIGCSWDAVARRWITHGYSYVGVEYVG